MKIRKLVTTHVLADRNGDEVEYIQKEVLVPFEPPVCGVCHDHMRNINTVEGKRRFQCVTWGCTNKKLYDEEGNQLGQYS